MVAMVPAKKDPMALVASAGPGPPRLAIWLPSIAVTMVALSPGVLRRMEVVEPAVHRAVVDAGEHDERARSRPPSW
jgi:hypothetical protein